MEETITSTLLTEFREFRDENRQYWAENEKRWEQNERRWEENEKRWKENDKRWQQNDKRLEMESRINNLEEVRVQDRRDILEVLDAMQKSISKRFDEMQEYMDFHFERLYTVQMANNIEHMKFKKDIKEINKRVNFQNARISNLEKWKDELENGEMYTV